MHACSRMLDLSHARSVFSLLQAPMLSRAGDESMGQKQKAKT
jgi:hypothetical protein